MTTRAFTLGRELLRTSGLVALSAAISACGGGSDPAAQPSAAAGAGGASGAGGAGAAAGAAGAGGNVAPTPPTAPSPPVFLPCPTGWTEQPDPNGPTTCEPRPLTDWACPPGWLAQPMLAGSPQAYATCLPPELPATCPDGSMPSLGNAACVPIGDPCPAGDFPDVPASGPVVYVKAGASGGDGTMAKPFATVQAALDAAPAGATVAIAKGTYPGAVSLKKGVLLVGACAAGVTLQGPAGTFPAATITVAAGQSTIRNVKITGGRLGVTMDAASAAITLRGVWLDQNHDTGIYLDGGSLTLDGSAVTRTLSAGGLIGHGLEANGAAKKVAVTITGSVFDANRQTAILGGGAGLTMTMSDLVVRGTLEEEKTHSGGLGIEVQGGAQATLERALVDGNRSVGIHCLVAGAKLAMKDVVVRGTLSEASTQRLGHGLEVKDGGTVVAERLALIGNRSVAAYSLGAGATLDVTDLVARDTLSRELDKTNGQGVQVGSGATVRLRRALLDGNREGGVFATGAGTTAEVSDVIIRGTQSREMDGTGGGGVSVDYGATLSLTRALLENNRYIGVVAYDAPTKVTLEDVVVQDTIGQESDDNFGEALSAALGASVTVSRGLFRRNRYAAVSVGDPGTTVQMTDSVVRETTGRGKDGRYGYGVSVQTGAALTMTRAVVAGSRGAGGVATDDGSVLSLADAVVEDTLPSADDMQYGIGLQSALGGAVDLQRVVLRRNQLAAVLVQRKGTATLSSCWLSDTHEGRYQPLDDMGKQVGELVTGVGDGLVVLDGSTATAEGTLVTGCSRAGVLFSTATGSLSHVTSSSNFFGMVLIGGAMPTYDATCTFTGNTSKPIVQTGDFPVPNAPLATPPPPPRSD